MFLVCNQNQSQLGLSMNQIMVLILIHWEAVPNVKVMTPKCAWFQLKSQKMLDIYIMLNSITMQNCLILTLSFVRIIEKEQ